MFGSLVKGETHEGSDVDLIIVKKGSLPFLQRAEEFFDLYDVTHLLDILVYTPEEFAKLTTNPSPGFWESVTREFVNIMDI